MRQSLAERVQADKGTFLQWVLQFAEAFRFGFRTYEIVSHNGLDAPSTHTVSAAVSGRRPWTSCLHLSMAKRCGLREPTCFDVAHRWLTKEAFVFAVELARALISNLKRCTRSIEPLDQHSFSRCYQTKLFLILKGAHGRQRTEMMMQG